MNFRYFNTRNLIAFLLVLAIVCSYVSIKVESELKSWEIISKASNWIDAFTTMGLILLVLYFVNAYLWKYSFMRWLIDVPNLNGRYSGYVQSSYIGINGLPEKKECIIEIKQMASSIHVFAYFGDFGTHERTSRSVSVSEQLIKENNGLFVLYYIFANESEALKEQLNNHLGTSNFKFYPDTKTFDGHYYNQRGNHGTIEVVFEQKLLLGRLVK